ncbi:MAG: gluconeogenesis factor YvcK family protein [Candidatus Uhrbacteria bacterium]
MKRIVTIGGGTGQYALLSGLKMIPDLDLTAVVTMADSGGSSGVLRTEREVLPPGDALRCSLALATADPNVIHLFGHRLTDGGGIGGHTIGNIVLTGATEQNGDDFLAGLQTIAKVLQVRGRVLPVTTDRVTLCVRLSDGSVVRGEHHIDHPEHDTSLRIQDIWLEPNASLREEVREAFRSADAIIAAPGDFYTSLLANIVVDGVPEAFESTLAKFIFVVNTMTKCGETDTFAVEDFVTVFEHYARRKVDVVVCNTEVPTQDVLEKYKREGAVPVPWSLVGEVDGRMYVPFPLLAEGMFARHDSIKLAHVIRALL